MRKWAAGGIVIKIMDTDLQDDQASRLMQGLIFITIIYGSIHHVQSHAIYIISNQLNYTLYISTSM